jgi:hypothetical protein
MNDELYRIIRSCASIALIIVLIIFTGLISTELYIEHDNLAASLGLAVIVSMLIVAFAIFQHDS